MRLNQVIGLNNGIYAAMTAVATARGDSMPWANAPGIDDESLDLDFLTTYGNRETSVLVDLYAKIAGATLPLSSETMQTLAKVVLNKYNKDFTRQWNVWGIEYDPLQNFDLTETEQVTRAATDTNEVTRTTNNQSTTAGNTKTDTTRQDNVYGFNSDNGVPSGDSTENTLTDVAQTVNDEGGESENADATRNETETRTKNTSGDNSVRSTQYMLNEEREAWTFDFFGAINKMIASVLTCAYYDLSHQEV